MIAYSLDLRERIVAAYDAREGTQEQLAARFRVSVSFVAKLLRQRRRHGTIAPLPHGGGRPTAFDEQALARLREAVRATPDATLAELADACGVSCSLATVFNALDRLGLTRKKSLAGRPSRTTRG